MIFLGLVAQLSVFVESSETLPKPKPKSTLVLSTIINGKPKDEPHTLLLFQMGYLSDGTIQTRTFSRIERDFLRVQRDLTEKNPSVIRE